MSFDQLLDEKRPAIWLTKTTIVMMTTSEKC